MKHAVIEKRFRAATLAQIEQANRIIAGYQAQGFTLTLRQAFYQFVARDLIPNTEAEYKKLGRTLNDARIAGLVDWNAIEDRTRSLRHLRNWESGADLLSDAVSWFRTDKWAAQEHYVEVWIEKDALVGVIEGVCDDLEVPFFACRGYPSLSEVWNAGQRFIEREFTRGGACQHPVVIHLGDHDPSGIDMTRDVRDRLSLLTGTSATVRRIALNMDQVEENALPPNPAKLTDTRAGDYVARYGTKSWELDALEPQVIADLVRRTVLAYRDEDAWSRAVEQEEAIRDRLNSTMANFREAGL